MGEIADDMIDGVCCSGCGCYFTDKHGYPVACRECRAEGYIEEPALYPFIDYEKKKKEED